MTSTVWEIGERPNPPEYWGTNWDGSVSCPHRNLSVCDSCVAAAPELVDGIGAWFWIGDPIQRADIATENTP